MKEIIEDIIKITQDYCHTNNLPVPKFRYHISAVVGDGSLINRYITAENQKEAFSKFIDETDLPVNFNRNFYFSIIRVGGEK